MKFRIYRTSGKTLPCPEAVYDDGKKDGFILYDTQTEFQVLCMVDGRIFTRKRVDGEWTEWERSSYYPTPVMDYNMNMTTEDMIGEIAKAFRKEE